MRKRLSCMLESIKINKTKLAKMQIDSSLKDIQYMVRSHAYDYEENIEMLEYLEDKNEEILTIMSELAEYNPLNGIGKKRDSYPKNLFSHIHNPKPGDIVRDLVGREFVVVETIDGEVTTARELVRAELEASKE